MTIPSKQTSLLLIGVVAAALLLFGFLSSGLRYSLFPKDFNSQEWILSYERFMKSDADGNATYREFAERKKMVHSLIRSENLLGKDRNEVKDVLGIDDNKFESSEWLYWIDFTAADNKWLRIKFDTDSGRVIGADIYED